jgi:NAD kinase
MATNSPRAVFVTRETDYELLLARHATREQARFFLETRGQKLSDVEGRHDRFRAVLQGCRAAVPVDWRQTLVKRSDFNRFLFGPEDIIVAVGQDGLVANVAKYLAGQPVLGVNPDPSQYDGMLVRLSPDHVSKRLRDAVAGSAPLEHRTMAEARLDAGGRLLALNEIFIGHRSHQSARYEIEVDGRREVQSSSGLIVASGTGATGWARSIMEATSTPIALTPGDHVLGYFVREPFPSIASGTSIRAGLLVEGKALAVTSRLNDGGAIFADGIEQDFLTFDWGRRVEVRVAKETLNLVTG